jgi:hypothetical protein
MGSSLLPVALVLLLPAFAHAQLVKVSIKGGDKATRDQVARLITTTPDQKVPHGTGRADIKIELQKTGGAKASCNGAQTFLPGPSPREIASQFHAWLPTALEARRAAQAAAAERAQLVAAALQAFAAGLNSGNAANATSTSLTPIGTKLMLFGGEGHRTYLGCLNCGKYDSESVLNPYGTHGNRYNAESIFNRFSDYGSRYGIHSVCNPHSMDPPVIVDGQGRFYGRLTVNTFHHQRTADTQLTAWIAGVCAG